jgi:hypothetical protein
MARKRQLRQQQPLLVLLAGLTLMAMALVAVFLFTGNNGGGSNVDPQVTNPNITPSTGGTSGGPQTVASPPASLYGTLLEELPPAMRVNQPETFAMNISTFASSYWFDTEQQGAELAAQWRIFDGFQAQFDPLGLAAQLLQGSYYIWVETYLFETVDGADAAYDHLENRLATRPGSVRRTARLLANESAGFEFIQGTVGTSEVVAAYHRFIFRRGNVIGVVQTFGGQPFMSIDRARDIAVIMDDKVLGTRPATEPTPIPTPFFPTLDPTPEGGE